MADFGNEAVGLEKEFHAAHDGVDPVKLPAQARMKIVPDDVAAGADAGGDEEAVLEHGFGVVRGVHEDHREVAQLERHRPVAGVGVNLVDAGRALSTIEGADFLAGEQVGDELAAAGLVLLGEDVDGVDGAAAGEVGGEFESAVAVRGAEVEAVAGEIGCEGGEDFGIAAAAGVEVAVGFHHVEVGLEQHAVVAQAEVPFEVRDGFERDDAQRGRCGRGRCDGRGRRRAGSRGTEQEPVGGDGRGRHRVWGAGDSAGWARRVAGSPGGLVRVCRVHRWGCGAVSGPSGMTGCFGGRNRDFAG